jgi:hypothetical protein
LFACRQPNSPPPPPSPATAADDWYERAKKATDRCDLELTYQTTGAQNGLADKVVWVTGLFDLNRNELTDFKRPLQEYYDRFNRILDRGACDDTRAVVPAMCCNECGKPKRSLLTRTTPHAPPPFTPRLQALR